MAKVHRYRVLEKVEARILSQNISESLPPVEVWRDHGDVSAITPYEAREKVFLTLDRDSADLVAVREGTWMHDTLKRSTVTTVTSVAKEKKSRARTGTAKKKPDQG